ncbi:MAG: hypothetical protein O7A04_12320 [Acidobacteria bacterium]|nr:hypothetical protein [Acidobacteriota bacterium]
MADFDFPTAEIEDGTGKTTSKVYFDTDKATVWLNTRGKTSLSGGTVATQESAMVTGHEMCEDTLIESGMFAGTQLVNGQGLIFPTVGAFDYDAFAIDGDAIPAEAAERRGMQRYFEGLCLAIEKAHLGKLESTAATSGALGEISEVTRRGRTVKLRQRSASFADRHPEIWRKIRIALPPPRVAWAV